MVTDAVPTGASGESGQSVLRVLHLEDDETDRALVRIGLEEEGFHLAIRTASTKEEFLSVIRDGSFDVIVSDSSLPSFRGVEALEIARRHYPEIPFIVYSGGAREEAYPSATAVIDKGNIFALAAALKQVTPADKTSSAGLLKELAWPDAAMRLTAILAEDTELGVVVFNKERRVVGWNKAMQYVYGISSEEVLGRPVTDVFASLGRNGEDLLLSSIVNGNPLRWRESSHRHCQRDLSMTVATSFVPLTDEHGAPAGGIILTRDRTTHTRMVRADAMVENAFRSALEGAADAILITDATGKILFANGKFGRMTGIVPHEIVCKSVVDILSPDSSSQWSMIGQEIRRLHELVVPLRVRNRNGYFEAEASVALVSGTRLIVVIRDVTDQVAEWLEYRQSKEFFQSLAESAGDAIVSVSIDQRVSFMNQSFTAMTGWSKWIWLGKELSSIVHPDDVSMWQYAIDGAIAGAPKPAIRVRLRCADGRYIRGESRCSAVVQGGKVTGTWHIFRCYDTPFFPEELSAREFVAISKQNALEKSAQHTKEAS